MTRGSIGSIFAKMGSSAWLRGQSYGHQELTTIRSFSPTAVNAGSFPFGWRPGQGDWGSSQTLNHERPAKTRPSQRGQRRRPDAGLRGTPPNAVHSSRSTAACPQVPGKPRHCRVSSWARWGFLGKLLKSQALCVCSHRLRCLLDDSVVFPLSLPPSPSIGFKFKIHCHGRNDCCEIILTRRMRNTCNLEKKLLLFVTLCPCVPNLV